MTNVELSLSFRSRSIVFISPASEPTPCIMITGLKDARTVKMSVDMRMRNIFDFVDFPIGVECDYNILLF